MAQGNLRRTGLRFARPTGRPLANSGRFVFESMLMGRYFYAFFHFFSRLAAEGNA